MENGNIHSSPEMHRVCYLSGISLKYLKKVKFTLEDAVKTLDTAVRESEVAEIHEAQWRYAEIAAKAVKGSCDISLEILGQKTGIAGNIISISYDGAGSLVSAINNDLGPYDVCKTMIGKNIDIIKEGSKLAEKKSMETVFGKIKLLWVAYIAVSDTVKAANRGSGGGSGIASATQTLRTQLRAAQLRLRDVNVALQGCE